MKTPKRTSVIVPLNPEDWPFDPPHHAGDMLARWKRKNRIAQLKHTIDKLTFENNIFKQTFIQNRAFLKELMSLIYEPNRSTTHRLADLSAKIRFKLMSLKDYERKEQG